MTHTIYRRLTTPTAQSLLDLLTERQFVRPHAPLREVAFFVSQQNALSLAAVDQAMQWLKLDPSRAIGRLRRTELSQLAGTLRRFSRQVATTSSVCGADQDKSQTADSESPVLNHL